MATTQKEPTFKELKRVHDARLVCKYLENKQKQATSHKLKEAYSLVIMDVAIQALGEK